jgi:transcriptional regulator with XRE-family HTH domain
MNLGERLKQLRLKKKLSLRELGNLAHISHSFIADIESGRSNPSLATLEILARVLGTTTSYLLGEESDIDPPTIDDEIMAIMRELGPDVTIMFYDLKGMSQEEKESLKIFLQGLLARRKQK